MCILGEKSGFADVPSVTYAISTIVFFSQHRLSAMCFISIPTKFLLQLVQACTTKKSPKKPESHKLDQLGHIFSQAYSGNSENLVFKN
jgi:hypothetical protein